MKKFKQVILIVALIFFGLVVIGGVISFAQKPSVTDFIALMLFVALEAWLGFVFYRAKNPSVVKLVGSGDVGLVKKLTPKKFLIASAVFFVLLIIVTMYAGKREVDQDIINAKAKAVAIKPSVKTPEQIEQQKQLDIEKLSAFHKQFTDTTDKVHVIVNRYKHVMLNGSVLDAYDTAKKSSLELNTLDESLKYPVLSNAAANNAILSLRHNFGNSLGVQYGILSRLEEGLDKDKMDLEDMSYIKRAYPRYDSYQTNMAIDVMTAYRALGVDFKDVDVKHGGLLKK